MAQWALEQRGWVVIGVGEKLFINNDFPLTIDWFRNADPLAASKSNKGHNNEAKVAKRNALQTMPATGSGSNDNNNSINNNSNKNNNTWVYLKHKQQ